MIGRRCQVQKVHLQVFLQVLVLVLLTGGVSGYVSRIAVRRLLFGTPSPPGSPWPMPQSWEWNTDLKSLDAKTFRFTSNLPSSCDIIEKLFERYKKIIALEEEATRDPDYDELTGLRVEVEDTTCAANTYPKDGMDESYELDVTDDEEAVLKAKSVWGAIRGVETFSQLIYLRMPEKKYLINQTSIEDFPRFGFRGVHIDTARHFLTMSVIMEVIETMSWNKFNVLHWHVVDDQSFPYPMRSFPNLTLLGSYSEAQRYSRKDVMTIIEEGRLRGIRVLPEFDTPGHTWSWGYALPLLITPCWGKGLEGGPYVPDYPNYGPREVMNPTLEYVYDVMETILQEIQEDFPEEYIHLGLDEAYYTCWQSNPNISDWMKANNFSEYYQLEQYYNRRIIDITTKVGAKAVIWQDPIDNNVTVPDDTLVTVWKDTYLEVVPGLYKTWQEYMDTITKMGYKTVLSAPWYFNYVEYGFRWKYYYEIDLFNFTDNPEQHDLVQGGELCTWSEFLDGSNLLQILWPDGSAVAERLWSNPDHTNSTDDAQYRLDEQRCRMLRRGVPAKPILPGYCDYEWHVHRPEDEVDSAANDVISRGLVTWLLASAALILNHVGLRV